MFDIVGDEASKGRPYKAVVTKVYDTTGDGGIDMFDVEVKDFKDLVLKFFSEKVNIISRNLKVKCIL